MHTLELRRQILHLLYGPLIILAHSKGILNAPVMLAIIFIGACMSYLVKRKKLSLVRRFLSLFERPHHLEFFPGRGILFFTIGAFLCLWIFNENLAYAGIVILSVGDAVANIIGKHFGRIKSRLNPEKSFEGTLIGILCSIPAGYYFFPQWLAVTSACIVAMFLELPRIKVYNFEIDDNLIVPLAASFTLSLFA